MARPRQAALTVSILVASLLFNVTLVSCAAEPTAPQGQTTEVLQKLAEISARLASIEEKMTAHESSLANRIDSLESRVTVAASGAVPLDTQDAARVDSILALASFIADDLSSGSFEGCGKLEVQLAAKIGGIGKIDADAQANVGAWAGTGAFAGALATIRTMLEGELGAAIPIELGYCRPFFDDAPPPMRNLTASGGARIAHANLSTSLDAVVSQLGLTQAKLETALGGIVSVVSNGNFPTPQTVASLLPIPAAHTAKFADPMGSLQGLVSARTGEAITLLCTGNWGSTVSGPITTACNRINSGSTDISGLFSMMEQFPAVQTTLTTVNGVVSTVCGRLNTIGTRSLTIPNPLTIGPTNLFGPTRLFPAYTEIGC